ncbi:DUF2332 domain-containing protein [Inhella proteolytica]|uniref:DUF2332 domain-containing protein n=1 Tax=Inhella proteolytica TaxID=2795029 RepID=A0A931J1V9_9BURK|nr:DUF2332 domain-containing protein [Inhella proteolytica]MBH9576806.1 DUF2332 domain-containing protein [Inhella proteolytica]
MHLLTPEAWAAHYRQFAAVDCPNQPSYVAICHAVAADPELLALHAPIPPEQARANLFLAAVHERLLAGVAHPLAAYFPSLGGRRAPDAELPALLRDFVLGPERPRIEAHLRQRATQTNEAGRSAMLRLALDALGDEQPRLALFEVGASAGLNLGVDEDRIDYGAFQRGPGTRLQLRCEWLDGTPPPASPWQLVARAGMDLAPVDAHDPVARRWLEACVWADDVARLQRLRQALAWAQARGPRIQAHADGLQALDDWRAALPTGVQPVLLTSWVLGYLQPEARQRFHAETLRRVREQGLAWICAEAPAHHPMPAPTAPPSPDGQSPMLLSLHTHAGSRPLLWSHPHGNWARAA